MLCSKAAAPRRERRRAKRLAGGGGGREGGARRLHRGEVDARRGDVERAGVVGCERPPARRRHVHAAAPTSTPNPSLPSLSAPTLNTARKSVPNMAGTRRSTVTRRRRASSSSATTGRRTTSACGTTLSVGPLVSPTASSSGVARPPRPPLRLSPPLPPRRSSRFSTARRRTSGRRTSRRRRTRLPTMLRSGRWTVDSGRWRVRRVRPLAESRATTTAAPRAR